MSLFYIYLILLDGNHALSFYTLLVDFITPYYALIFLKKEKKKKLGFSLNSFSVPGFLLCVCLCECVLFCVLFSVVVVFCCLVLLSYPPVPYFTALWCRKKQKQTNKKF